MKETFFVLLAIAFGTLSNAQEIRCCCTLNPAPGNPAAVNFSTGQKLCQAGSVNELWQPGQNIRIKFMGGTPYLRQQVEQIAQEWTQFANIRFQFVDNGDADIRIAFKPGVGSWSTLGTGAFKVSQDKPTMNFGWFDNSTSREELTRTTLHEFGHALGLIHEHQSPKASIPWNRPAVYDYYKRTQTPPWEPGYVDTHVFATYAMANTNSSAFDPKSIMIYPISNDLTLGDFEVRANNVLSNVDKEHIAKLYPGRWKSNSQVSLTSLRCVEKQEAFGRDEIHVRVFADGKEIAVNHTGRTRQSNTPIFRLKDGEVANLGLTVNFKRILKVEIWEIDKPEAGDQNDLFGCVTITQSGNGTETIQDRSGMFEKREHQYQLAWR